MCIVWRAVRARVGANCSYEKQNPSLALSLNALSTVRVADDTAHAQRLYDYISNHWFISRDFKDI